MFKKLALSLLSLAVAAGSLLPLASATAASVNLINNPSVESAASSTLPVGWNTDNWGTNTASFSYKTNDGHNSTKSLYVNMSAYSTGDAKWYFNPVTVSPNQKYTFTDYSKSNVATEVDIEYVNTSNQYSYVWLSNPAASATNWQANSFTFTTPSNVKALDVLHVIHSVGWLQTDDFSLVSGTTPTATAPTVSLTAPANNATVSGTQTISANASDAVSVAGVQFKVDGTSLGSEDIAAPYSISWDTTKVANGSHTVSATARNSAGLTSTATETVTVSNATSVPPTGSNLIPNPSFETSSGWVPAGWLPTSWGTNTASFGYLTNNAHTGTRSVRAEITSYTNGAANWYYAEVPVTGGQAYKYENWYQSNVATEVDAEVTMSDGSVQYDYLGAVPASTSWAKFDAIFTAPTGAKSMAIYQILAKKGYILTDDYSLTQYTPAPFNRPIVSITFDDGWTNQYTNALPLLQKYNLNATFYIISGELTDQPDYMSGQQVLDLHNKGMEIGSHTITHPDLTTLSQAQVNTEMAQSQTTLQNLIGSPVTDFAYPYGAYNDSTISIGKQYYQSQRTVDDGLNTKDMFNVTKLKIHEVDSNITQQQVFDWVNQAIAQKAWLILVYHEVATTPTDPTDGQYHTVPADLNNELAYLKFTGVPVETVNQALNELTPQL